MISIDTLGRITFINPSAETLTGWKFKEAEGKELNSIFEIINDTSQLVVQNPADKVLQISKKFLIDKNSLVSNINFP